MTHILDLIDIVYESRQRMADTFPLPSFGDCVRYAITEGGEMIDAQLRQEREYHRRNNSRNVDPRTEFGQMGYMIASALIQNTPPVFAQEIYHQSPTVYSVLIPLNKYMDVQNVWRAFPSLVVTAMATWADACTGYGWDAADLLTETCAAFEAKWAKVAE